MTTCEMRPCSAILVGESAGIDFVSSPFVQDEDFDSCRNASAFDQFPPKASCRIAANQPSDAMPPRTTCLTFAGRNEVTEDLDLQSEPDWAQLLSAGLPDLLPHESGDGDDVSFVDSLFDEKEIGNQHEEVSPVAGRGQSSTDTCVDDEGLHKCGDKGNRSEGYGQSRKRKDLTVENLLHQAEHDSCTRDGYLEFEHRGETGCWTGGVQVTETDGFDKLASESSAAYSSKQDSSFLEPSHHSLESTFKNWGHSVFLPDKGGQTIAAAVDSSHWDLDHQYFAPTLSQGTFRTRFENAPYDSGQPPARFESGCISLKLTPESTSGELAKFGEAASTSEFPASKSLSQLEMGPTKFNLETMDKTFPPRSHSDPGTTLQKYGFLDRSRPASTNMGAGRPEPPYAQGLIEGAKIISFSGKSVAHKRGCLSSGSCTDSSCAHSGENGLKQSGLEAADRAPATTFPGGRASLVARLAELVESAEAQPKIAPSKQPRLVTSSIVKSSSASLSSFQVPGLRMPSGKTSQGLPFMDSSRSTTWSCLQPPSDAALQIPVIDLPLEIQEGSLRSRLLAFAEAIATDNQASARSLLKGLKAEASAEGNVMQRVARYFLTALWARCTASGSQAFLSQLPPSAEGASVMDEFCMKMPYFDFCVSSIHGRIMEIAATARAVHVVDVGAWPGLQWGQLLRQLASIPGGSPSLRLTCLDIVGIRHPRNSSDCSSGQLQSATEKLMQEASILGVSLDIKIISLKLENLRLTDVIIRAEEELIITSCMKLYVVPDASVMRWNPRDTLLQFIRQLRPRVLLMTERDFSCNGPFFLHRFRATLDFYISAFEANDSAYPRSSKLRQLVEQIHLGKEILNIVACEGSQRVVRSESLDQWRTRLQRVGFANCPITGPGLAQLQKGLVRHSSSWTIREAHGCCQLVWKDKPMLLSSAWTPKF